MYKKERVIVLMKIPAADFGLIGGSSTLSIEIPEQINLDFVEVIEKGLVFPTPYGDSPEFKYLSLTGEDEIKRTVLVCRMHGWRSGVSRADASRQVFYVFQEAKIKKILAEGGVGAINHLLKPRDIVVPYDYIDASMRKDVALSDRYLLVMRDALCSEMRQAIVETLQSRWQSGRVFDRGVYVNTDGRHFESPAEINSFKLSGADVVGQSMCPEVYLAREIAACYAGLYLVVNYAEGIVSPWQHEELAEIFYSESRAVTEIMLQVLRKLSLKQECACPGLRKDTLLSKVY